MFSVWIQHFFFFASSFTYFLMIYFWNDLYRKKILQTVNNKLTISYTMRKPDAIILKKGYIYKIVKQGCDGKSIFRLSYILKATCLFFYSANGAKRIAPKKRNIFKMLHKVLQWKHLSFSILDLVNWPKSKAAIFLLNLYGMWDGNGIAVFASCMFDSM